MNQERIMKVLLSPVITEKSSLVAGEGNQVVFRVATDASKPEIKKAVEQLFEVQVGSVRVANVKGKTKRFGQRFGSRKSWKKAYVTLKGDQNIDLMGAE